MAPIAASDAYLDDSVSFDSFKLDPRLLQAIKTLGFKSPTLVQAKAIPLALEQKRDIIAKASTGSGKTAAYAIPIIQSVLTDPSPDIQAIVLVPTRELASQVTQFFDSLTKYCGASIRSLNLSSPASNLNESILLAMLLEKPDIIISTPSKLVDLLAKSNNVLDLKNLKYLCIDEVDLVLSYGYDQDLENLSNYLVLKQNLQIFLMSATIDEDVNKLKAKFCRAPAILRLNDELINQSKLVQYYVKTSELDKFLLCYVIFKLQLIKGKTLCFVNNIDRGYRLKLFLEQFGIKACVLNSELPINSRLHIVEEFNKNVYNLLIATDETNDFTREVDEDDKEEEKGKEEEEEKPQKKMKKSKQDKEYGVSRGVDFQNVACVLNFDLPTTSRAYVHRIGRTARAGKSGMALSFVVDQKLWGRHKQSSLLTAKKDEKILAKIVKQQTRLGFELKPYTFDMKQVDGFRYRMEDGFRAVTGAAIREARIKEIKNELLTSDKLKRHFEENPQDYQSLRHDKDLHPARVQQHLKRVPEYLLPESARTSNGKKLGFIPFNKVTKKRSGKRKPKKVDPLKSFKR